MERPDEHIITAYLENRLSESELDILNQWIRENKANADELFSIEEAYRLAQAQNVKPADIDAATLRLNAAIDSEKDSARRRHSFRGWRAVAAVAAVAVILIVAVSSLWNNSLSIATTHMLTLQASADATTSAILPDGTKVWLNRNATLSYPEEFKSSQREVRLTGEAYFEVVRDTLRPFIVEGQRLRVKVLGTKFNFSDVSTNAHATVALIQGSVEVSGQQGEGLITLQPGQRARIDTHSRRLFVEQTDTQLDAIWHDDLIPFGNANINEIAATLQHIYNVKVEISPDLDVHATYSGYIRRKADIASVLHLLQNTVPIDYQIKGSTVILSAQKK